MVTANYLESAILAASPAELIQLLYEGASQAVRDARRQLEAGQIAARSAAISKAMSILAELTVSLDSTAGGELAARLAGLYDYMQGRLLEANLRQQDAPLAEVLGLLNTLAEGWQEVVQQNRPAPAAVPAGWMAAEDPERAHSSWTL